MQEHGWRTWNRASSTTCTRATRAPSATSATGSAEPATSTRLGYGWFTVDYAYGEYDNFDDPTLDYDFLSLTGEYEGFHVSFGTFGRDAEGDYVEAGYGTEVSGIELGVAAIYSDKDLAGGESSETSLVFTIGKTFDLGSL